MPIGSKAEIARVSRLMAEDRGQTRRKKLALGALFVVLCTVSMCITMSTPAFITPVELVQCIVLRIQQFILGIIDPAQMPTASEVMAEHPTFYWTMTNIRLTLINAVCGIMLAISGVLFQNVFRNPIASPSMLGVSSGVQLGIGVLVLAYGTAASVMVVERYAYSYVAVAIVFAVLFVFSALMSGKGKPRSVASMLVVGVIINQIVGVGVTYLTWYVFDDEMYYLFAGLTTMVTPESTGLNLAFLAVGLVVGVLPVVVMRFRMNSLQFDASEMKMLGVGSTKLQAIALLCGTVAMVTAQLQIGVVAMITLVVPHLARTFFGAEFRKQLAGTMLLGGNVVVGCHIIAQVFPYGGEIPVGVVINLVLLPLFCWMMARQQSRWS